MSVAFTYTAIRQESGIRRSADMASSILFCEMCKIPLAGKDQFLGHQMISHELEKDEAERAWQIGSAN
jgi:hypothetical protein